MDMTGLKYGKPEPRVVTAKRQREAGAAERTRLSGDCLEARQRPLPDPELQRQGKGKVEMHHVIPRSRSSS
jgi:hypothetical protein